MRISRWLLGPALALSLVATPAVGADAAPKADSGLTATPLAKPKVKLAGPKRGKAALKALAGQLDIAAGLNKTSVKKLHDVLASDPTAWISGQGHLFYADEFARSTAAARTSTSSADASIPPAPEPLANTFLLHSIPGGSDHTIYLDFNGVTLGAGSWVDNGWTAGSYRGFSLDSDYANFSDTELEYIQQVWEEVADKYAPFDIDVTTQDPGPGAYNRNGIGDTTYGDHVVFTDEPTGSGAKPPSICPEGCDGISFNGAFDDPADNVDDAEPVWVYTDWIQYHWNPGWAGEVAAHEIGHTLGLHHDGLGSGDGAPGSGNDAYYGGTDLWSPVMGNGFGALSQFSKGEYPNASNTEDDFAVMQTFGVNLRSDDWGDAGSPSALGQQSTYAVDGVLEDAADQDVFTIDRTCSSPLNVRVSGVAGGQTVDLGLRVLDAPGTTVLGEDNPYSSADSGTPALPLGVNATVTVASPPIGTIQIEVSGLGETRIAEGYTDYGSVGRYHLSITGCSGTNGATPSAPASLNATILNYSTSMTVSWEAPTSSGDSSITGYRITGLPSGTVDVPGTDRSEVFTDVTPGQMYRITVSAVNAYGAGTPAYLTKRVDVWAPTVAAGIAVSAWGSTLTVQWTEPPNPGHARPYQWVTDIYDQYGKHLQSFNTDYGYSSLLISGVGNGQYQVRVWLSYEHGGIFGLYSPRKTVEVGPSASRIGKPSSGTAGGTATTTVRWLAPVALRGQRITSYTLGAYKLNSLGGIVRVYVSSPRRASARAYVWALPKGRYRFRVQAHATGGWTPVSKYSTIAISR